MSNASERRYGFEQDKDIQVRITDESDPFCFAISFAESSQTIVVHLHARSVVDLCHKLQIALFDWQSQQITKLLEGF